MDSVKQFTDELFSVEPRNPGSVNLDFDVESPSELFEVLLLITTNGLKLWHGDDDSKVDISYISEETIVKLQKHFMSFNIAFNIDIKDEPGVYMIDNKSFMDCSKLEDMTFTIASNKKLYIIHFGFLPGYLAKWT